MLLAVGANLGPYGIRSPLGAGGMGEVYRAASRAIDLVMHWTGGPVVGR